MQTSSSHITLFIIATTGIIFLLAGLIITLIYLYRKKQLIFKQNFNTLKIEHERNVLKAQVEVQEQTFHNISREIHDNISLSLTLAKLNLNMSIFRLPAEQKNVFQDSINMIGKALDDLRDVSRSMNPETIRQQGLLKSLEKELAQIGRSAQIKIDMSLAGDPVFMEPDRELVTLRILQEAFNNIVKHANASEVRLQLTYNTDRLEVQIKDNGVGFSCPSLEEVQTSFDSSGLTNMRNRARVFNGLVQIKSAPGEGTHIIVTMPYQSLWNNRN